MSLVLSYFLFPLSLLRALVFSSLSKVRNSLESDFFFFLILLLGKSYMGGWILKIISRAFDLSVGSAVVVLSFADCRTMI